MIVIDVYNRMVKRGGYCGTLTTHPQDGHSGTFWIVEDGKDKDKTSNQDGIHRNGSGGVFDANQPKSKTRRGRVQGAGHICPTITSQQMDVHRITKENDMYRIRKLSSRECFRLMGYTDEDYEKAESVNSQTQLYKQAGNAICENVLVAIFGQMLPGKEDVYKTIARNEDGSRKPYVID